MQPEGSCNRALVVIAHGSRSEAANEEFRAVLGKLDAKKLGFSHIEAAFLEAAPPTLVAVVECLARSQVRELDIYPLFFNCGRHVAEDIPTLVAELGSRYPDIQLRLLPYFGSFGGLAASMAEHIEESIRTAT
jgi:sirohydrochlorin ferrochelatase